MSYIDDVLNDEDRPIRKVETPEWKCGSVYVRSLSAREALNLEAVIDKDDKSEAVAHQLSSYLCDEAGNRVCSLDQGKSLLSRSANVISRIIEAGNSLNGRTVESQEAIKGKS